MITLYHGTNKPFKQIDLTCGSRYKDFGQGFYLTPDLHTAQRMARKRAVLFGGTPTLLEYNFDEDAFHNSELRTLVFPQQATIEWARFIDSHRSRHTQPQTLPTYDIVIGPIADDGVAYLLGRYHEGTTTLAELAHDLQDRYLDQQYYFGTPRALQYLTLIHTHSL